MTRQKRKPFQAAQLCIASVSFAEKGNKTLAPFSIINAKIVLPDEIVSGATLVIKNKKIASIGKRKSVPRGSKIIDARGNFVGPGFVDLHIHGDVEEISSQQVKGGTTGFLATLHPARPKRLLANIDEVLCKKKVLSGAKVLGVRLEGPFLNRSFCGALPPEVFRAPAIKEARAILKASRGFLKMVVVAPELKGASRLIRFLRKHGVVVSLGHSGATYKQALRGIAAGITHATHTFNRMRPLDHRAPGALAAVLTDERVYCEAIADGIHVHPAALLVLLRCKRLQGMMLVTDSTQAQKEPPKRRHGEVFKLKNGTLYGSALRLNKALANACKFLNLSLPEAMQLLTLNPARMLKVDRRKGSIAQGKDADLVIFNSKCKILMTIVEGKIVYKERAWLLKP
ncbi:MAG: N-acetylglucosamine-6-phosphate deacetylase [Candidatus Omnitrophica bacterium]|nr:N-acetylglucosamine-6-phosphate deacetylase [Candidatus Omnitrophota bacterium]